MSRKLFILRTWLIFTMLLATLTSTPALAQGGTTVQVDPSTSAAQVNDRVDVQVKASGVANLTAFEVHLAFDPAVLEVIEVTNGGFVAADVVAQNVFDNAAGTVDYAIAQMNRPAVVGSGVLLSIAFRVKANGSSVIALRSTQAAQGGLLLSDENGTGIQASWIDGMITAAGSAAITETPAPGITSTAPPVSELTATITPTPTQTDTPLPAITTNTPTVTPTSTYTPTPITPGPTTRIHTVRSCETLFCIGRAYGVWPFAIAEVNGIWWPYTIYPNQKLNIPTQVWSPMPAGTVCPAQFNPSTAITVTPSATPNIPTNCRATYIVRPGDTLYRIGVNYGIAYTEIARVNQIANARLIYVGQQLCIP